MLAGRRAVRAERMAGLLARLSPDEQAALAAALPAMDALASAQRDEPLVARSPDRTPSGTEYWDEWDSRTGAASPFRQPKAVFAVAFACVVSFMGIGLVDPILPSISMSCTPRPAR